jgi:hypothetical protein
MSIRFGLKTGCDRSLGINTNCISWTEFAVLISNRFVAETSFELIDSFRHMEQTSTVTLYIDSFEELMGKLKMQMPSVTEYLIGCFLSSLKEHIKIPLRSHCPRTLVQAYSLTRNYDTAPQKRSTFDSFRLNSRPPYPLKLNQNSTKKDNTNEKQTTSSKWEKRKILQVFGTLGTWP